MKIHNDRKIRWGHNWQTFDLDNATIKFLKNVAKKRGYGGHFLKLVHRFLTELYTNDDVLKAGVLVIDFGFGFSVWSNTTHCAEYHNYSFDDARARFKEVGYCDLKEPSLF